MDRGGTSIASGEAAEAAFLALANSHGFVCAKTFSHVDQTTHVDFVLVSTADAATMHVMRVAAAAAAAAHNAARDGMSARALAGPQRVYGVLPLTRVRILRVDVKAAKPFKRDGPKQYEELWLELHGYDSHNDGWLLGGSADVIAVETRGYPPSSVVAGAGTAPPEKDASTAAAAAAAAADTTADADADVCNVKNAVADDKTVDVPACGADDAGDTADHGVPCFVLLDRVRLGRFALQRARFAKYVRTPEEALYGIYARSGHTLLMRVLLADAYRAAGCGVWWKP